MSRGRAGLGVLGASQREQALSLLAHPDRSVSRLDQAERTHGPRHRRVERDWRRQGEGLLAVPQAGLRIAAQDVRRSEPKSSDDLEAKVSGLLPVRQPVLTARQTLVPVADRVAG